MKVERSAVEKLFVERRQTLEGIAERAKAGGARHHVFVAGDGEVCFMDEWDSRESFEKFFHAEAEIGQLMQAAGVQGPPEIRTYELLASPDRF